MIVECLLMAALSGSLPIPDPIERVEFCDQHGDCDRLSSHRGEVVVAMVVTARRLRNLKGWERDLRREFEDLNFFRVVDIPEDSTATREDVVSKLDKRVPQEISVLIDSERRWARDLELDTSRPNVLLFDRQGRIVAREYGLAKAEQVQAFAAKIRELLSAP